MAIIWSEKFSVNVKEIDRQHRELVEWVNKLDEAMRAGKGKDLLGRLLSSLLEYTRKHFAYEQHLLESHHYPALPTHQAEHINLTEQVVDFQKQFENGTVRLTIPMMSFLSDWLTQHIQGTDKAYSAFLNQHGVK